MKIEDKHIIYFVGIGGIGMSALARWFLHLNKAVYGYDKTETPLTKKLIDEGAVIHYDDATTSIPAAVLNSKDEVLVVWTPAIPKTHLELNYLINHNYTLLKRSEVLGAITEEMYSVAIAGTHGKTTTSSMVAHILKEAGKSSIALMGGILQGYESNLIIEGEYNQHTIAVLEADEFDRSFLKLSPDIAVVTSADADHLDIYGEHEEMKSSFQQFIQKVKPGGHVFINEMLTSWLQNKNPEVASHSYALEKGENKGSNIHISGTDFVFDFEGKNERLENVKLPIPGDHNVENAIAAISIALQLGIDADSIKAALGSFKGVKRRFEYLIKNDTQVFIDDYAHHPIELKAFLSSVKKLYPNKRITAIFQPHLFSRTKDFADGFAESLDLVDEVLLMNIYPARELPIEGITSKIILDKMKNTNARIVEETELLELVANMKAEILVTVGAGDIDQFVQPIKQLLEKKL